MQSLVVNDFCGLLPCGNRPGGKETGFDCGRVLVPVSLSGRSQPSLAIARELACEVGVEIVLLHVVELNIAGEERGIPRMRLLKELCREAELELRRSIIFAGLDGRAEIVVSPGRPAEVIVETARRWGG